MVNLPEFPAFKEFLKQIPDDIVFRPGDKEYGKTRDPHITVLFGIEAEEEEKAKQILSKIPGKLVATLGKISLFKNVHDDIGVFDVLKIDVTSPQLTQVNKLLTKSVEFSSSHPEYHPHVTLAYLKPGTGEKYVGDTRFSGMKFLFDVFIYSTGNRDAGTHTKIPMLKEYLVGASGGYGSAAGGAVASPGWAGTFNGPAAKVRLDKFPTTRTNSYMQNNTVVNNSLYDTIRPEDLEDPKFKPDEIMAGLRWEMKRMEYPDKNRARPIVLSNLNKDPHWYSDLGMYFNSDKE
jgi:2'-5' RNA ligase